MISMSRAAARRRAGRACARRQPGISACLFARRRPGIPAGAGQAKSLGGRGSLL